VRWMDWGSIAGWGDDVLGRCEGFGVLVMGKVLGRIEAVVQVRVL